MSPQKYGAMANSVGVKAVPCVVCGEPEPCYSWTDLHGEGYCVRCGTPYQLVHGTLAEGETYPRCNIESDWIPVMQRFWKEEHRGNGSGTFLIWKDYPDQIEDAKAFDTWLETHLELIPTHADSAPSDGLQPVQS